MATEQAVFQRRHITVEIWRRTSRQIRSFWPAAQLPASSCLFPLFFARPCAGSVVLARRGSLCSSCTLLAFCLLVRRQLTLRWGPAPGCSCSLLPPVWHVPVTPCWHMFLAASTAVASSAASTPRVPSVAARSPSRSVAPRPKKAPHHGSRARRLCLCPPRWAVLPFERAVRDFTAGLPA